MEIKQKSRAEERPDTEEQSCGEVGMTKIEESPERARNAVGKQESAVERGGENRKKVRGESLEKAGNAAETRWSTIGKAWDIVTTCLSDEQSMRDVEAPLK